MNLIKRVPEGDDMVCVALFEQLRLVAVLNEIVEFTGAFILRGEMLAHRYQRLTREDLIFLDAVHF